MATIPSDKLSPADAAILETFVVPRYLSLYGDLVLEMFLVGEAARIAHLGCRTGYPDRKVFEHVTGASLIGIDPSLPALELARNKATVLGDVPIEYHVGAELPTELEEAQFSHVFTLHPIANAEERAALFAEMSRLLYSGGQALVAMPLRGSFQEINDLLKEYALKHEDGALSKAVEASFHARPTIETLSEELEAAGLDDVDVEIRQTELSFDSGRALAEDPVTRLMIVPELKKSLNSDDISDPIDYVRQAVDKYWADSSFGLSLNVGCASARKP